MPCHSGNIVDWETETEDQHLEVCVRGRLAVLVNFSGVVQQSLIEQVCLVLTEDPSKEITTAQDETIEINGNNHRNIVP